MKRIHVNPAALAINGRRGNRQLPPVMIVHEDGTNERVHGVQILGPAEVVYEGDGSVRIHTDSEIVKVGP